MWAILDKPYTKHWRDQSDVDDRGIPVADLSQYAPIVEPLLHRQPPEDDGEFAAKIRNLASFFLRYYEHLTRAKDLVIEEVADLAAKRVSGSIREEASYIASLDAHIASLEARLPQLDAFILETAQDYAILVSLAQKLEPEAQHEWESRVWGMAGVLSLGCWSADVESRMLLSDLVGDENPLDPEVLQRRADLVDAAVKEMLEEIVSEDGMSEETLQGDEPTT